MADQSNPDILTLQERVRTNLTLGESHFREFKSALEGPPLNKTPRNPKAVKRDIGETLVAFANADGGQMLVGVEDDGTVTGVPHNEETIQSFLSAYISHVHQQTPLPHPQAISLTIDGKRVLYFSIQKGTEYVHLTQDGRCLQRKDRESVPVSAERISFERQERQSREYDRQYLDGASVSALDSRLLEAVGDNVAPGLSIEKVLQLLDLVDFSDGGLRLRRAAALLFASEVTHWHPRCEVRVLRVSGNELRTGRDYNVVSDKHVVGNILTLLVAAWDEIRPYLVETRLGPDGRFQEQVRYPEDACREALTNAIAHRDYSVEGRAIEVYVFDDRVEVRSPGPLLSTITISGIKTLDGLHQSRNTTITRTLRELGYMREMGEGFRRMFQLMRAHDLVEPELRSDDQGFSVALKHQSVFSDEDQRWISAYENFDLERDEEKVLLLGRAGDPLSVQQIMDAADLVDTEDYRTLIERLLHKGLILGIKKSATSGKRTRNQPRWRVVQPKDANRYYGELISKAQEAYKGDLLAARGYADILRLLGAGSPYLNNGRSLQKTFVRLGLADAAGNPAGRFLAILEQDAGSAKDVSSRNFQGSTVMNSDKDPEFVEPVSVELDSDGIGDVESRREPTKLYIGNLSYSTTAESIRNLISSRGNVLQVQVPSSHFSDRENRGFAFVVMRASADAKAVKNDLEGYELDGRRITLEWARS
ncbi:ATP-binding protein [Actinocrispum sp. NPDC049592]|uniref:ATP-binding protein n=1 Tax=Actinocrispum sp. NPDC049592 TaxID=3154835 RepID=UPI00341FB25E